MSPRRPTVLIIEHDPDLRELEELVLSGVGYRVVTVPAGADPLRVATRTRPRAIVVGIREREPADWQIVDRLLTTPATSSIPVVVTSTAERMIAEAQAAPNVRQTIIAPYDIEALEKSVAAAIGSPPAAALLPRATQPVPGAFVAAADALSRRARVTILATLHDLLQIEEFRARFPELTRGLSNNLAQILGAIIEGLRRGLSPDQVFTVPKILQAIKEHDQLRHEQGIPVALVLREDQLLRAQTDRCLRDVIGQPGLDALAAFDVSQQINAYFDELIRIVVSDYCSAPGRATRRSGSA